MKSQTESDRRRTKGTKGGGLPRASAIDQGNLFGRQSGAGDVGPATRASHPITSHRAAKKAANKLTLKQLAVLHTTLALGTPTHEEIVSVYRGRRGAGWNATCSWYPDLTDSSIRTRVKELVALGYAQVHDEHGRSSRGNKATRWTVTAAGILVDIARQRGEP